MNIDIFKELPNDILHYIYKIATKTHFDLLRELKSTKYRITTNVLSNLGWRYLCYWKTFRKDDCPLRLTHPLFCFRTDNHITNYKYLSKNNLKYELYINNILVNNQYNKSQLIKMLLHLQ